MVVDSIMSLLLWANEALRHSLWQTKTRLNKSPTKWNPFTDTLPHVFWFTHSDIYLFIPFLTFSLSLSLFLEYYFLSLSFLNILYFYLSLFLGYSSFLSLSLSWIFFFLSHSISFSWIFFLTFFLTLSLSFLNILRRGPTILPKSNYSRKVRL